MTGESLPGGPTCCTTLAPTPARQGHAVSRTPSLRVTESPLPRPAPRPRLDQLLDMGAGTPCGLRRGGRHGPSSPCKAQSAGGGADWLTRTLHAGSLRARQLGARVQGLSSSCGLRRPGGAWPVVRSCWVVHAAVTFGVEVYNNGHFSNNKLLIHVSYYRKQYYFRYIFRLLGLPIFSRIRPGSMW